jgi:hypothetical protein
MARPNLVDNEWLQSILTGKPYPPSCKSLHFILPLSSRGSARTNGKLLNMLGLVNRNNLGMLFAETCQATNFFERARTLIWRLHMSKLLKAVLAAALGFAVSVPLYAADTTSRADTTRTTEAWSDSQYRAATNKCNALSGTEAAKCIVNIRRAGGGGSSLAVAVPDENANTVKSGKFNEEEYMAAMKRCDAPNVTDKDRCVADVKDHFGRM